MIDTLLALKALQEDDYTEAQRWLLASFASTRLETQSAIDHFDRSVASAILTEKADIEISLGTALLIAVALKSRVRPRGRPPLSQMQKLRNQSAITLAANLKHELISKGLSPGVAEEKAAREAAGLAGKYGCRLGWTAIRKGMRNAGK